jgi:adenylate cyclase class 2
LITYKGKKLSGAIKARRELEWRLDPGDPDGKSTEELLELLGFRPVATVGKQRVPYTLEPSSSQIAVVVDHVGSLGVFAELERVVADKSWVEAARAEIAQLSAELGLQAVEPRSYLEMTLKSDFGAT